MPIDYKYLVESLRLKRGLSVKQLCGDYISHSTYSRFINKGQALSVDKFLYLLSHLDINEHELSMFDYVKSTESEDVLRMAKVIQRQDLEEMKQQAASFDRQSTLRYDHYGMMAIQIRLKMGGTDEAQQLQNIKDYIFQIQEWSSKEIQLYTLILYQHRSSVIMSFVNRIYQEAANPIYLEQNMVLIYLLDVAYYEFIKRSQKHYAKDISDKLAALLLIESYETLQAFYAINRALHAVVFWGKEDDYTRVLRLYKRFNDIKMDFLALRLRHRYDELQVIHNLAKLNW